jgi:hypothetical protein
MPLHALLPNAGGKRAYGYIPVQAGFPYVQFIQAMASLLYESCRDTQGWHTSCASPAKVQA